MPFVPHKYLEIITASTTSYILDAIDDYMTTSQTLNVGDVISVTFDSADFSTSRPFFRSTPSTVVVDGGGNLYHANNGVDFDVEINGSIEGNWYPMPTDGRETTLAIIAKTQIVIDAFGILGSGDRFFSGKVKGFAITKDGITQEFTTRAALSNGFTAHNFNDENWV